MVYKRLAKPRKITSAGSAVAALATLESDRLVAAICTDPVKLVVMPMAGGAPKAKAVSLDEASAVALIDKRVAVVKSGDDLWALLDIQHSPKVEQCARDIRSLHAHPGGGSAFALSWDGSGHALTIDGNDVADRQFVLRGDLRTASLASNVTWGVVDAGAGGQLREHPGATPEPGASARGDLPAEAKAYDRLAGGRELCALTKAGAASVCVAMREGPAAFTAKMISVPGGVADVAVVAGSLLALGSDGVLRIYEPDALRRAGAEAPAASFEQRIGGSPLCLAVSHSGGAKAWVGTRDGDVWCCNVPEGELDVG